MPNTPKDQNVRIIAANQVRVNRPSLMQAIEVEKRLKVCSKFALNDRAIFSQNLGAMVSNQLKADSSLTMRQIFTYAFGNAAESLFKKRKSIVTLPGELPKREALRSKARDYLNVIDAIAKIKSAQKDESQDDIRMHQILCLVDGSSFDDQRKIRDRMFEESLSQVKNTLTDITNAVLQKVDLDYLYLWAKNYCPVKKPSLERSYVNLTAPRVKILDILKPLSMIRHAFVTIKARDLADLTTPEGDTAEVLRNYLYKHHSAIKYDKTLTDFDFSSTDTEEWPEEYQSMDLMFPDICWIKNSEEKYYIKSSVFLEIRYDEWTSKWITVPVWKSGLFQKLVWDDKGDGYEAYSEDYERSYFRRNYSDEPTKTVRLFADWDTPVDMVAVAYESDSENTTFILFETEMFCDDFDRFDYYAGVAFRAHSFDEQTLIDISELDTFIMGAENVENEGAFISIPRVEVADQLISDLHYTPAPMGSIANIILNNLAYASHENKLSNLLLENARNQYDAFDRYKNESELNYKNAMAGAIKGTPD